MPGRKESERGSATVQLAVVTPALLLLVMLVVQFALYQHAAHLVTAAAQEGVQAAQVQGGSGAAGRQAARDLLAQVSRGVVEDERVEVTRTGERAHAVVTGRVLNLVPGLRLSVRGVADGPVERVLTRAQRG